MKSKLLLLTGVALATLTACGGGSQSTQQAPAPAPAPAPAEPAAPANDYVGGPVTDGGTVSGTVSYTGTEADATLTITKDKESCALHGETRPAEGLVVAGGTLANVVVYIDGIKKGKEFAPGTVTLDNSDCHFVPHVLVGWLGGKVAAKNSDPILHNTNLSFVDNGKQIGNIALPNQGMTVEKDLRRPGMVAVKCDAHEWMSAHMYVSNTPYAIVTGADGKFSFDQVPAGTYTVKFWHEKLGEKTGSVTVTAAGTATADVAYP